MKKFLLLALSVVLGMSANAQLVDAGLMCKQADKSQHYNANFKPEKGKSFIVISKKDQRLYVYGVAGKDTALLAKYPACLSRVKGQKQRVGDMKTPSSPKGKPFSISAIQNASGWRHDFKDGRGNILAYGHWFMRLVTPGHNGIGIHGSTNNRQSVPGRASEGCIRLRDEDIIDLKDNFAFTGMKVTILDEETSCLPFEKRIQGKAVASAEPAKAAAVTATTAAKPAAQAAATSTAVKQQEKPKAQAGPYKTYVVKSGDTLDKIARKHGSSVAGIRKINNLRSDNIQVGKTLKIPTP